jgi:lipoprotein-anchoring transpeptidase ErfK/SrfK
MRKIVNSQPPLTRLIVVLLSATALIFWQSPTASLETDEFAASESSPIKSPARFWELVFPPLPPLAESEQYLPSVAVRDTRLVIRLNERRVYVYQDNQPLNSYPIAVGKQGWETPTGKFQVLQMLENPSWQHPWNGQIVPPGSDNPLGRRWIGFWTDGERSIGFHGTPNEELVGQAVSHGCIRMRNNDVQALFDQVTIGTTVIVQP